MGTDAGHRGGALLSFSRNRDINLISGSYYTTPYFTTRNAQGVALYLTPRVMWCPGKRFFMDASLNIGVLRAAVGHSKTTDPSASYPRRTTTNFGLPRDGARLTIGFGLKL